MTFPSRAGGYDGLVAADGVFDEAHFREIEEVLLYIGDSRKRAQRAIASLRASGAEPHLVEALERADRELEQVNATLMQQTYFAVPKEQLSLG